MVNPSPNYYAIDGHNPSLTPQIKAVVKAFHALGFDFLSSRSRLLQILNGMEQMYGGEMEWIARPPSPNAPPAMPNSFQDATRSVRVDQAVKQVDDTSLPQSAYNCSQVGQTETVAETPSPHQVSTWAASNPNVSLDTPTRTSQGIQGRYSHLELQSQPGRPPSSHGWGPGPAHEHAGPYPYQTTVQGAPNLYPSSDPSAHEYSATAPAMGPAYDAFDHNSQSQSVISSEAYQPIPSYAEDPSYPTDPYSGTPHHYIAANGTRATQPSTSSIYGTDTTTASDRYFCLVPSCKIGSFGIRRDYENHMNTHRGIKYQCAFPDCLQIYGTEKSRDNHLRNFHHSCLKCESRPAFNTTEELQTHKRTVHRQIPCDRCSTSFETPRELNQHNATEHLEGETCDVSGCGLIFASTGDLQKHWETNHPEEKIRTLTCSWCHKQFWELKQLRNHVCIRTRT